MSWVRILLIALGLLLAAGGTAYYAYAYVRIAEARDWPNVGGAVTASRVDVDSHVSGTGSTRRRTTDYLPRVEYGYSVNGRALRGTRIWLTERTRFSTREAADRFIAGYAPGARVRVHYNPADPADAALIVESRLWPIFILIGAGLLMIGLGGFLPMRR